MPALNSGEVSDRSDCLIVTSFFCRRGHCTCMQGMHLPSNLNPHQHRTSLKKKWGQSIPRENLSVKLSHCRYLSSSALQTPVGTGSILLFAVLSWFTLHTSAHIASTAYFLLTSRPVRVCSNLPHRLPSTILALQVLDAQALFTPNLHQTRWRFFVKPFLKLKDDR